MIFFVVKKQRTNEKNGRTKVGDGQHVGAYKLTPCRCRIESARLEIGQILRTDL